MKKFFLVNSELARSLNYGSIDINKLILAIIAQAVNTLDPFKEITTNQTAPLRHHAEFHGTCQLKVPAASGTVVALENQKRKLLLKSVTK